MKKSLLFFVIALTPGFVLAQLPTIFGQEPEPPEPLTQQQQQLPGDSGSGYQTPAIPAPVLGTRGEGFEKETKKVLPGQTDKQSFQLPGNIATKSDITASEARLRKEFNKAITEIDRKISQLATRSQVREDMEAQRQKLIKDFEERLKKAGISNLKVGSASDLADQDRADKKNAAQAASAVDGEKTTMETWAIVMLVILVAAAAAAIAFAAAKKHGTTTTVPAVRPALASSGATAVDVAAARAALGADAHGMRLDGIIGGRLENGLHVFQRHTNDAQVVYADQPRLVVVQSGREPQVIESPAPLPAPPAAAKASPKETADKPTPKKTADEPKGVKQKAS